MPLLTLHLHSHCHATVVRDLQDSREDRADLIALRKWLHANLLLPTDWPLLRTANAVKFGSQESSTASQLQNVHRGLKASGVKGGSQHLVRGSYSYFHYLQAGHLIVQCKDLPSEESTRTVQFPVLAFS